jgi:hypothetical protein
MGDALAWPERKPQARMQIHENDGAMFELLADDAVRREAQPSRSKRSDFSRSSTPRVITVIRGLIGLPFRVL